MPEVTEYRLNDHDRRLGVVEVECGKVAVVGVMVGMSVLVVSSIYILSVREATARAICAGQIENRNAIRRVILRAKSLTVEDVDSQRFYRAVLDEDVPTLYCDNSGVPSEAPREEP